MQNLCTGLGLEQRGVRTTLLDERSRITYVMPGETRRYPKEKYFFFSAFPALIMMEGRAQGVCERGSYYELTDGPPATRWASATSTLPGRTASPSPPKYPDIIKPVYQTENQYSKGVSITKSILFPQSKGKYTAICEGDDYWCDENKLQKQVDFLESHEGYAACVHNTRLMDCRTGGSWPMYKGEQDRDLTFKEVVNYSAACFHTSSILCRREWFCIPDELRANGFGDYPRAVYMRLNGKIRYLKYIMSVYRMFTAGSWTARNQNNASKQQRICSQKARTDFTEKLRRYCREQGLRPNTRRR